MRLRDSLVWQLTFGMVLKIVKMNANIDAQELILIDFFFFRLKIILVTFNYSFNERFLHLYCWIDFCIWFYTTVTRNIQTNSSDMTTIRSAVARIRTLSLTHAGRSFYPLYNRRSQFVTKCIST